MPSRLAFVLFSLLFACGSPDQASSAQTDPSCPVQPSSGEATSQSLLPGAACTVEDAQCFTLGFEQGAWLRCCSGAWTQSDADAGFTCPK
jgi:hypothetical protein